MSLSEQKIKTLISESLHRARGTPYLTTTKSKRLDKQLADPTSSRPHQLTPHTTLLTLSNEIFSQLRHMSTVNLWLHAEFESKTN